MNGIIVIDKPAGWTSHDVAAKLRGALKEKRVGHSGTLDPMATGVLPIFIGRATRAVEFFGNDDKEYIAGLRLGLVTDTMDVTGTVIRSSGASVSEQELAGVIARFLGAQKQMPPMYSAIKIGGKKLYELARRGEDVPRPARDIVISEIELLNGGGSDFLLRVECSKGTYIRSLCHDIGEALGCGGVMSSLRRTRAGIFTIEMARTLNDVLDAVSSEKIMDIIIPIDSAFSAYPAARLSGDETRKCKNGALHRIENLSNGEYRFYGPDNEFLLLGEVKSGAVRVIKSFYVN